MPPELAEDYVPEVPAPQVADPGGLSPDGVDAAERMAVRIRNVGCGTLATGSGFALDERTVITNRHVVTRSEEHTSELQSRGHLVCRLLLEKKKQNQST